MRFLDSLAQATRADLDEIGAHAAKLEADAAALRGLAVLIERRLADGWVQTAPSVNGTSPPAAPANVETDTSGLRGRKPPGKSATTRGRRPSNETRDAVARYLFNQGSAKAATIVAEAEVSNTSLFKALKGDWFTQNDDRTWQLTGAGVAAAKVLQAT